MGSLEMEAGHCTISTGGILSNGLGQLSVPLLFGLVMAVLIGR